MKAQNRLNGGDNEIPRRKEKLLAGSGERLGLRTVFSTQLDYVNAAYNIAATVLAPNWAKRKGSEVVMAKGAMLKARSGG